MKASIENFIKQYYSDLIMSIQLKPRLSEIQPKIPELHQKAFIDYYNLAYAKKDKELLRFISAYLFRIPRLTESGDPDIDRDVTATIELYESLIAELPVFQEIVDKGLDGTALTKIELAKVKESVGYSNFIQTNTGKRSMLMLLDDPKSEFLKAVYGVVIAISQRTVVVKRCGLANCKRLFIPYKSGSEQIYCSIYHRQKSYALK